MKPLPLNFFRRSALVVARELVGAEIRSAMGGGLTAGLLLEAEAYLGRDDPASHAFRGRRHSGNQSLYGPPGTWYVYRSYGIHWCANLVCGGPEAGSAVLLRGVWLREGLEVARRRRGGVPDRRVADGPGKLCQALGITRELDGFAMAGSDVVVSRSRETANLAISVTPRIGISKAVDWPLRFMMPAPE